VCVLKGGNSSNKNNNSNSNNNNNNTENTTATSTLMITRTKTIMLRDLFGVGNTRRNLLKMSHCCEPNVRVILEECILISVEFVLLCHDILNILLSNITTLYCLYQ